MYQLQQNRTVTATNRYYYVGIKISNIINILDHSVIANYCGIQVLEWRSQTGRRSEGRPTSQWTKNILKVSDSRAGTV